MSQNTQHIDDNILAKFFAGEANISEINVVLDWVDSSEENIEIFNQYEKVWSLSRVSSQKPFDANRSWVEFNKRINTKRRKLRILYSGIAAAIIGLVIIFSQIINNEVSISTSPFIVSSVDSPVDAILPDGSMIRLSEESKIEYSFDLQTNTRVAKLDGKAFFDIKRDTSQKFIVKTQYCGLEVLGTQFNVEIKENSDVQVDVLSGRVKLFLPQTSGDTIYLIITDNETAIISMQSNTIEKQVQEASAFYIVNETIVFNNTDLSTIIAELTKCYSVEIELDSTVNKSLKFTSSFKENSLEEILTIITQTHNLNFSKEEGSYFIKSNEK
jgi:ferric-dicitrate binding protein FerR (iron transport regulator)